MSAANETEQGERTDAHSATMETSRENVAGWVGGAQPSREHIVPSEPASKALCADVWV